MRLFPVEPRHRRRTWYGVGVCVILMIAAAGVPEGGGCGGIDASSVAPDGGENPALAGRAGAPDPGQNEPGTAPSGTLGSDGTSAALAGTVPTLGPPRCDPYVYIDDGQLELDGKPFALKGVNYRVEIVAKAIDASAPATGDPRVVVDGQTYDLFLAPNGSYQPDNNSWCRDLPAWNPEMRCCADGASCARDLDADMDHVTALGATSVRLLMDTFEFDANNVPRLSVGRIPYLWTDFQLDMRDQAQRAAANHLMLKAVQKLGVKGVRSLLLLNGKAWFKDQPAQAQGFDTFLADLATTMRDEPFLIGYDFYNEPSWSSGAPAGVDFSITKLEERDLVQGWADVVHRTAQDTHHLLTIGNAHPLSSVGDWDPAVLPLDFNSYHVYPRAGGMPTNQLRWADSHDFVEREAYYASLGGCGIKCPYLGSYDGANCFIAAGPPMSTADVESDGLYYTGRNDACPAGALHGGKCLVASPVAGRDQPFTLTQPIFYVSPVNGGCPAGAGFDGANCVIGQAPLGTSPFVWGDAFYYKYLSPTNRCVAPARDDGANCYYASVPAGYKPFILTQPLFYVAPVRCGGGRIPYILGETDFAVNEVDMHTGAVTTEAYGTAADQADYLRGSGQNAISCGYQGYLYWQHGDVHWGDPSTDHDGLWADFRQVFPGQPVPQPDAVVMRPAGLVLRDELDFSKPQSRCDQPGDWGSPLPAVAQSGYRYNGKVIDERLKSVPFALLTGTFTGGVHFFLNADGRGNYSFSSPRLVTSLSAGHFGYNGSRNYYPVPVVPDVLVLDRIDASQFPAYHPPSANDKSCRALIP